MLLPNTKKDKKADKQNKSIQALFNHISEDTRTLVTSTSGTSKTIKLPESIEPINEVVNMSPKETPINSLKPVIEVSSTILLTRQQHEERLRKKQLNSARIQMSL